MRRRAAGFTLIEMMVALAVFSLAALTLVRLESATIRGTATARSSVLAGIVARNVAVDAVTDTRPPAIGRASGTERNGGADWAWTREVSPTGDARLLRIDVTVTGIGGASRARLAMLRYDPPAAS